MSRSKLSDFKFLEKLGKGSYGTAYKVQRKVDGNFYVVKQVHISSLSRKEQLAAINEVRILASLTCKYVIRYYDSFIDNNTLNIVMEIAEKGTLHLKLKKMKESGQKMGENQVWKIFLQICLDIHSKKILHRDIKSLNVFFDSNECLKIGDLGVAKAFTNYLAQTSRVGTPYYLSPELCENKPYSEKSDVWALGCIVYECCTYRHPFNASDLHGLMPKIIAGKFHPISSTAYSSELAALVSSLLTKDPTKRPTLRELLRKPEIQQKARDLHISMSLDSEERVPRQLSSVAQANSVSQSPPSPSSPPQSSANPATVNAVTTSKPTNPPSRPSTAVSRSGTPDQSPFSTGRVPPPIFGKQTRPMSAPMRKGAGMASAGSHVSIHSPGANIKKPTQASPIHVRVPSPAAQSPQRHEAAPTTAVPTATGTPPIVVSKPNKGQKTLDASNTLSIQSVSSSVLSGVLSEDHPSDRKSARPNIHALRASAENHPFKLKGNSPVAATVQPSGMTPIGDPSLNIIDVDEDSSDDEPITGHKTRSSGNYTERWVKENAAPNASDAVSRPQSARPLGHTGGAGPGPKIPSTRPMVAKGPQGFSRPGSAPPARNNAAGNSNVHRVTSTTRSPAQRSSVPQHVPRYSSVRPESAMAGRVGRRDEKETYTASPQSSRIVFQSPRQSTKVVGRPTTANPLARPASGAASSSQSPMMARMARAQAARMTRPGSAGARAVYSPAKKYAWNQSGGRRESNVAQDVEDVANLPWDVFPSSRGGRGPSRVSS